MLSGSIGASSSTRKVAPPIHGAVGGVGFSGRTPRWMGPRRCGSDPRPPTWTGVSKRRSCGEEAVLGFPQFSARLDSRNGVASLALVGELDLATVSMLEEHLALLEGDGVEAIMLDLRDITFLDCTALQAFLAARDRANENGHRLVVVEASSCARRLFTLAGTEFLMDDEGAIDVLERFAWGQPSGPGRGAVIGVGAVDVVA
jgi:anti-sigma B factor antagonist